MEILKNDANSRDVKFCKWFYSIRSHLPDFLGVIPTQTVPLPSLLLFQDGDPHQAHHQQQQPHRDAGWGHRGRRLRHTHPPQQEEEPAGGRCQAAYHHHRDGFVEVGPAWGAAVRVLKQPGIPIRSWTCSSGFHGFSTVRTSSPGSGSPFPGPGWAPAASWR